MRMERGHSSGSLRASSRSDLDLPRRGYHCLKTRPTESIDGDSRNVYRQAGEKSRLPHVVAMILAAPEAKSCEGQFESKRAELEAADPARAGAIRRELAALKKKMAGPLATYRRSLAKLLPLQRSDFKGLFEAMDGYPVTIRTLDPPLHEFLPKREDLMVQVELMRAEWERGKKRKARLRKPAKLAAAERLLQRVEELHEFNPMLGHRGCRLGITYPEITEMQARAIFEAAVTVAKEGVKVFPEVMIPLTATLKEMANQGAIVRRVADEVFKEKETTVDYLVGTMIELPRAALVADEIAKEAEFFSFGTNDLTQTTFGFSRDDINKVLPTYLEEGILKQDPFAALDREGVGQLIRIATERGRKTRPGLKVGICGEHGGEPSSVEFCHQVGLNYVSCSPFRVLTARLAAAQAAASDKLKVEAGRTK